MEATQTSIKEWMDKQKVVYAYKGIVLSLTKKSNLVICYNMDEAWGTLSELSQLQKDKYYYDSTHEASEVASVINWTVASPKLVHWNMNS